MAENKQVSIKISVDEAQLNRAKQLIGELTRDLVKLNDAMRGAGVGGAGGLGQVGVVNAGTGPTAQTPTQQQQTLVSRAPLPTQGLVQAFSAHRDIFKNLTDTSKESLRMLSDSLKGAVSAQSRELTTLQEKVKATAAEYKHLRDEAASAWAAGGANQARAVHLDQASETVRTRHIGEVAAQQKAAAELRRLKQQALTSGGFQMNSEGVGFGGMSMGWAPSGLGGWMRVGGMALAGAAAANQEARGGWMGEVGLTGQRGAMVGQQLHELANGNYLRVRARNQILADSSLRQQYLNYSGAREGVNDFGINVKQLSDTSSGILSRNLGSTAGNVIGAINPLAGILNFATSDGMSEVNHIWSALKQTVTGNGPGGRWGGWTSTGRGNREMGSAKEFEDQQMQRDALFNMAWGRFTGSIGDRISSGRVLGLGFGENKVTLPGGTVLNLGGTDRYAKVDDRMFRMGLGGAGALAGAHMALSGSTGEKYAYANQGSLAFANASGYGFYGPLLAAAGRAGPGRDYANAFLGGGIDMAAGASFGHALLGSGFDPRGQVAGIGALQAFQQNFRPMFTGGAGDFNAAEMAGRGLMAGDRFSQGSFDAYQNARNLSMAARANPGLNVLSQDYLANGMTAKQQLAALGGEITPVARALLGRNAASMIRKQVDSTYNSLFDRWRDTGSDDEFSQNMRRVEGMRQKAMSGGPGMRAQMTAAGGMKGDLFNTVSGYFRQQFGLDEEVARGYAGMMLEFDPSKELKRKTPAKGIGKKEQEFLDSQAEMREEQRKKLEAEYDSVTSMIKQAAPTFQQLVDFGDKEAKVFSTFLTNLDRLSKAMESALTRIGK